MALRVPDPPTDCRDPLLVTRKAREDWWHVWRPLRAPSSVAFNPGHGVGRFHPIWDSVGNSVATYYGASHPDAAIFESVMHDIRESTPDQRIYPKDYQGRVLSRVRLIRDVTLVDLSTLGRHRLRVSRADLVEPVGHYHYKRTARWAEYLMRCSRGADGLTWPSRRFDTEQSIVLFEPASDAIEDAHDEHRLDSGPGYERIVELAEAADITIVLP